MKSAFIEIWHHKKRHWLEYIRSTRRSTFSDIHTPSGGLFPQCAACLTFFIKERQQTHNSRMQAVPDTQVHMWRYTCDGWQAAITAETWSKPAPAESPSTKKQTQTASAQPWSVRGESCDPEVKSDRSGSRSPSSEGRRVSQQITVSLMRMAEPTRSQWTACCVSVCYL